MTKSTLAIAMLAASLIAGCAKKTDTTTTDSTSAVMPAATETSRLGSKDSGLNASAKSEGMTGILADSTHHADTTARGKAANAGAEKSTKHKK